MIKDFKNLKWLIFILILGLIIRVSLNNLVYSKDAESFVFWGFYLKDHSIISLYENLPGGFTPLPPFYYYITRYVANIVTILNLSDNQWATYFIFKIPVYFAEFLTCILIYFFVHKYINKKVAAISSAFYFLHPANIYNSASWGQIDSFVSMLAFLGLFLFIERKYLAAMLAYSAGILSKLQDLAVLPLLVLLSIKHLWFKKLFYYSSAIGLISLTLFLPIIAEKGIIWTTKYFYQLQNWYPYTSIYSYNLWALNGFIISDKAQFFSLISYKLLGLILYLSVAFVIILPVIKIKKQLPKTIMFAAFLLFFDFAFFSTRVHSRYILYSLPFLSPLISLYPQMSIIYSILIIANLMLPFQFKITADFVELLNTKPLILFFTCLGFLLFVKFYSNYVKLINSK